MADGGFHLIPLGKIDKSILYYVMVSISETFGCPTTIGESLPVPEEAFDPQGNRYSAVKILQNLKSDPAKRLLAIADLDLFIQKVKYLFGLAETPGRKGIVGIQRLRGPYECSMLPSSQFLASIAKEAIHEIGHTFGLRHCQYNHCVMAFSRTLADTHYKRLKFCRSCARELAALMRMPQPGGKGVELGRSGTVLNLSDGIPVTPGFSGIEGQLFLGDRSCIAERPAVDGGFHRRWQPARR